ncbi:ribosome assembly RNA-binding protein YhbY [Elusimicrobiota bacterium]
MLTGKQKRYLRSLANRIKTAAHIGKEGVHEQLIGQLEKELEARELVKVSVLGSSLLNVKDVSEKVIERTGAEFVQSIGKKFVLYRRSVKKPVIVLPE